MITAQADARTGWCASTFLTGILGAAVLACALWFVGGRASGTAGR